MPQVGNVVFPALGVPEWGLRFVLGLLVPGFPIAVIFSWVYELTPEGLKRERDIDRGEFITQATGQKINTVIVVLPVLAIGAVVAARESQRNRLAVERDLEAHQIAIEFWESDFRRRSSATTGSSGT